MFRALLRAVLAVVSSRRNPSASSTHGVAPVLLPRGSVRDRESHFPSDHPHRQGGLRHRPPTAARPITARSAVKKILGSPGVRSEIRYFGGAFAAFFPISGPRVEIQLVDAIVWEVIKDRQRLSVRISYAAGRQDGPGLAPRTTQAVSFEGSVAREGWEPSMAASLWIGARSRGRTRIRCFYSS